MALLRRRDLAPCFEENGEKNLPPARSSRTLKRTRMPLDCLLVMATTCHPSSARNAHPGASSRPRRPSSGGGWPRRPRSRPGPGRWGEAGWAQGTGYRAQGRAAKGCCAGRMDRRGGRRARRLFRGHPRWRAGHAAAGRARSSQLLHLRDQDILRRFYGVRGRAPRQGRVWTVASSARTFGSVSGSYSDRYEIPRSLTTMLQARLFSVECGSSDRRA